MKIKIIKKAYHRNGVSGNGFNVVLFKTTGDPETKGRTMLGILFKERGSCSILDLNETVKGNIEFANGNSWRGDWFEDALREAIKEA